MGSASSKFRKHLQNGDEVMALQLYGNNSDLRKALDPNCSYGDSHQHETPLHYAARHGMKGLLRIFLERGGNPNKTNGKKETSLHCVCMEKSTQFYVRQRRADSLLLILKWRGATLQEGEMEKADLAAQDEKKNTSLHYAAASGLKKCVEWLVHHGAPLFVENDDNLTPCDLAEKNGHSDIALYLESKMVFSTDGVPEEEEDDFTLSPIEEYSGLRAQDLQEAKDQLLVETADMLSVPLFTAEALLRNHEWSREALLESWMTDAFACCERCGVTPPATLFSEKPQVQEHLASPLPSPSKSEPASPDTECEICACTFPISDEPVHMTCDHDFCRECWERYLNLKIQEGDAHHITCPAFDCTMLVPVDVIESVVSRDMALRYLQFDIKAFVDSNPDMKWCPYPGCGRAVKLPDLDNQAASSSSSGPQGRIKIPSDTSRGVDCGAGHYFCWECLEDAHEPCSCDNWKKWALKVSEVKPEQYAPGNSVNGTEEETETAANCLWLVTNSKPCPNCKSPIQKNEGCNHMKCSKCKHDFCWVCLEQWKRHNSSTGGYFKCNRYEAVKKVEEKTAQLVTEAEEKNTKLQELNRFVHYYTRFKNHENSYKLEEPLLKTAKNKMMKLAQAVTDTATANTETKFVEDAVHQLLKARLVLKCSYVYGYYLDGPGYKKIVFEFMQTELEEGIEILSQMVNRLYLRTPRKKIIDQAHIVQRKRLEFITAISMGLVPPETPPSMRKKKRKKYSMETEDEDLRKAILASIQEVDPANPWIKDASGRHTNVMAYLEWPAEDSDDSDTDISVSALRTYGKCCRPGCSRPRAPNPRTGDIHDYCSLSCLRRDQEEKVEQEHQDDIPEVILDEHMDLLRALEMSRLQYLRESGLIHVPDTEDHLDQHMERLTYKKSPVDTGRPRSNSESMPKKKGLTPMEELDQELQRVLEISSTIPKESDSDGVLKVDVQKGDGKIGLHKRKCSQSHFDETTSTLVPRVPNKSVEDLYRGDGTWLTSPHTPTCACDKCVESLGAYAAPDNPRGFSLLSLESNTFGAIKDLSVSNIHATDDDKTKDFLSKDFAALFQKQDGRAACSQSQGNGGKLFAANTPSEDDCSYVLNSPSSEKSALSTQLWRPRAAIQSISSDQITPVDYEADHLALKTPSDTYSHTDESKDTPVSPPEDLFTEADIHSNLASELDEIIASGFDDLVKSPSEAELLGNKVDLPELSEADIEIALSEVCQVPEVTPDTSYGDSGHVSLLEMAENLLQMSEDMHMQIEDIDRMYEGDSSGVGGDEDTHGEGAMEGAVGREDVGSTAPGVETDEGRMDQADVCSGSVGCLGDVSDVQEDLSVTSGDLEAAGGSADDTGIVIVDSVVEEKKEEPVKRKSKKKRRERQSFYV
ncbi:ankyrin repeat and IBR domain-containing protein 1-like isoform X2 [Haliotis rufescens]|uniref:ankyrin repeat and IBR domain-containing protein 1-like isoform X2 n=1 Tax=Haliotis rufescens TaxID=6454 RepID=UPI001EB02367|nr:ankyrin repeat and IBR domain-containing protein 1-like isoform X2 [Haliotis rufescens]